MIVKVEQYTDTAVQGKTIVVARTVETEEIINITANVQIAVETPQGVMPVPVNFEIPCLDIEEAFELFDGCLEDRIKEMEREHKEANLVVGPDGQPIGGKSGNDPIQFPG